MAVENMIQLLPWIGLAIVIIVWLHKKRKEA